MGDIADSLWRIIKPRIEEQNGLGVAETPKKIRARRGMAYINSEGGISTKSGSDPSGGDETGAPGAEQETDPENAGQDEKTNAPGSANGGAAGGPDGASGDVDDLLGASNPPVLDTQIGTLTGTDPDDGSDISIDLNRACGAEYDAPAGWDTPDQGPIPELYQQGYKWASTSGPASSSVGDHSSPVAALNAHSSWLNGQSSKYRNYSRGGYWVSQTNSGVPTEYQASFSGEEYIGGEWVSSPLQFGVTRNICGGGDPASVCPASPEAARPTEHPSDGSCKIAYDCAAGGFKGHSMDPDCSATQKTASTCQQVRSASDPNQYYRVCKLGDGGNKVTPVDNVGAPVPGGITYVTDGTGKITGVYDSVSQAHVN